MAITSIRPANKVIVDQSGRLNLEWDAYFSRLESQLTQVISAAGVISFEGRNGVVVGVAGDYTASEITNVPAGSIAATNIQAAINELDSEKQPLDADLTAWAAQFTTNVVATGLSGIENNQFFIYKQYTAPPPSGEISVLRVQRHDNYTGGTIGNVYSSIWAIHTVEPGVDSHQWACLALLDNYAASTDGGENVAFYGQGNKRSTGFTWAGVLEFRDHTSTADPVEGGIGLEIDMFANGTDASGNRVALDVIVGKGVDAGVACVASYGVRIGPQSGNGLLGSFTNGIFPYGNFQVGINLSAADCTTADIITKGNVGIGTSSPDRRLHSEVNDAVTAAVTHAIRMTHTSTGTAAAGFGVGLEAELENASGSNRSVGSLAWVFTDATASSEDVDVIVNLMSASGQREAGRFTSDGRFDITFTTDAQFRAVANAAVDARLVASNGSNACIIGTYSAHDTVFFRNVAEAFRADAAGLNLASGKVIKVNSTQIATARQTGWTAATNTKTRATFDTTTVTLPVLAAHVGALIDDLITHGLIGT